MVSGVSEPADHDPDDADLDHADLDDDELDEDELDYDDEMDGDGPARRRWPLIAAAVVVVAGLGVGLGLGLTGSSKSAPTPEGVPVQNVPDLASPDTTLSGAPVGPITCRKSMDQGISYHVHTHVAIFVDGHQERIPAGVGIVPPRLVTPVPGGVFVDNSPSSCLYWLHVHADDGIIHVEAPQKGNFTLGQFFDIWNQPLGPDQVGPARGPVVAFVNGQRYSGNPRTIPLNNLEDVQLDVGTPVVPFRPLKFTVTGSCESTCGPPPSAG